MVSIRRHSGQRTLLPAALAGATTSSPHAHCLTTLPDAVGSASGTRAEDAVSREESAWKILPHEGHFILLPAEESATLSNLPQSHRTCMAIRPGKACSTTRPTLPAVTSSHGLACHLCRPPTLYPLHASTASPGNSRLEIENVSPYQGLKDLPGHGSFLSRPLDDRVRFNRSPFAVQR